MRSITVLLEKLCFMPPFLYTLRVQSNYTKSTLGLLAITWAAVLVLPHFQDHSGVFVYIFDLILIFGLMYLLKKNEILSVRIPEKITSGILFIVLGIFPGLYLLFKSGLQFPYEGWSKLGAGSMRFDGEIFPFGDLVHITSASTCSGQLMVGSPACDLWDRSLNQNPLVIEVLRILHFTNIEILGFASYLLFAITILALSIRFQINGVAVQVFILTPPAILAFDRGNEIISITFILFGLAMIEKESLWLSFLGALVLSFSVIFKLWPAIFVFFLCFISKKVVRPHVKALLVLSIIYWAFNFRTAFALIGATQHGSPSGNSFGLSLFWNNEISNFQRCILIVASIATYIYFYFFSGVHNLDIQKDLNSARFGQFLIPIFSTYIIVWVLGDSFSYRLLILLPALLILSQEKLIQFTWARKSITIIIVTALSARMPIFIAISSAAAAYFATFILTNYNFMIRSRRTKSFL